MITIGIPKEIKPLEKRVGLTPSAVLTLTNQGIPVIVESMAGDASGFSDSDYQKVGAKIVSDLQELYGSSQLIVKVKEPQELEYPLITKKHVLFCYLHLASPDHCALVETLVRSGSLCIGFETVELEGRFPLLAPMSEIAGALAPAYAAALKSAGFLNATTPDPGLVYSLLEKTAASYPSFASVPNPGRVVIFGGGVAGFKAMETVLQLRGEAAVIERDESRRDFLSRFTHSVHSPDEPLKSILEKSDILIGCVHSRGERAAQVLDEKTFRELSVKKNRIIVDVAIDQGGNFPESGLTHYSDAVYFDSMRNLRFGVSNMPSLCGRGASEALSEAILPYVRQLALNADAALSNLPELNAGVNVKSGVVQLASIRQAHRRL